MTLSGKYDFLPMKTVKFGSGSIYQLQDLLLQFDAKRVFLLASRTLDKNTDLVRRVEGLLGDLWVGTFSNPRQHVPREVVIEAANAARNAGCDVLVSFGGGSVTDLGKAVTLCIAEEIRTIDALDDYMVRFSYPDVLEIPSKVNSTIPHVAIPTTLSAGEFTHIIGITDEKRKVKDLYIHENLEPKAVILDSQLTLKTPMNLWLSSGIRALDHCVEALCSSNAQPFTDALCSDALKRLITYLPACKEDPLDLDVRTQCQVAAWESIFGLNNVNLGLSHGLGHQLGARCNVPHGITSCVVLPAVMEFNHEYTVQAQQLIKDIIEQNSSINNHRKFTSAGEVVREFIAHLGLPTRLRDVGVQMEDFEGIADDAMSDFIVASNPRPVAVRKEVIQVLFDSF